MFRYCPLPCNGVRLQSAKLNLKTNVRFSTPVKVEIVLANSKRNTGAKICILHTLHSQENPITTPPCLIHNPLHTPHSPQVSQSSFFFFFFFFFFFLILSRTPLHSIDQVLWRDLASPVVSPPTNVPSLEQPCDLARSRPIGLQKKIRQHPLDKSCLSMQFFHFLFIFLWGGMP